MNLVTSTILVVTIFCIVITKVAGQSETTTAAAVTKEKTNVKESALCKKCICNLDTSLLDCSEKLGQWLSAEEWEILTNGDYEFKTIKLEHNNLTSVAILPKYSVENLYLAYNQIADIADAAFQNLTELSTLDLSHNKLTAKALRPDVFKGRYSENAFEALKNMKSLNLGNNEIHSLDADLFEHIPYLEELILCSNTFQVIDKLTETAISGLTSLKTLDISYLEIEDLPTTVLHGPRDLDDLIASGNLFRQLPEALKYAKNLERLVLDENPIASLEGDNVFPPMTSLRYLRMSYMPYLFKIGTGALSELQNLTELILSDNKVLNEIDELALSKNVTGGRYLDYPPLEHVYLKNCNLTTLPTPLLVRWDKLKTLDLRFNPWSCDTSNDHLINILIQQINKTNPLLANDVLCATPSELKDVTVLRVSNEHLAAGSSGSLIWVGLLVVLLIAIPTILGAYVMKRRGCFGLFNRNENGASRALYNRTSFNEDFHI
ncbi:chondroadherin [Drosophila kikkawai]|uniref:Chondroadherin n=1 Tax=Drosophila kikkawai TaxID=30033 RepID=A0A6P4IU21_DROKI|nr:carboxypeptidase N subunit 2 [Drosophila kikkawai]KAH8341464.1 hypothetical protein KR059_007979 [Drosophila kikkawai]